VLSLNIKETAVYSMVFFGIIIAGSVLIPFLEQPKLEVDKEGNVLKTAENQAIFAKQAKEFGSKCGNLEDKKNIQHLSHHPALYEDCLKQVKPERLKEATGKTLEELLGQK
jgi:transposase